MRPTYRWYGHVPSRRDHQQPHAPDPRPVRQLRKRQLVHDEHHLIAGDLPASFFLRGRAGGRPSHLHRRRIQPPWLWGYQHWLHFRSNRQQRDGIVDVLIPPDGGASPWNKIGDSPCVILPNKKFLLGNLNSSQIAQLDPATLTWTDLSPTGKADNNGEEGWTLLPDGTVLTVDTALSGSSGTPSGIAEIYTPSAKSWVSTGPTGSVMLDGNGGSCCVPEMGPQVLLPDGTVFAIGATPYTAIYTYTTGKWTPGPTYPAPFTCGGATYTNYGEADGPAALLPNGNVLLAASPFSDASGNTEVHCTNFYEFDGTNLNPAPGNPDAPTIVAYGLRMLVLPSGDVLVTHGSGAEGLEFYNNGLPYNPSWQPTISSAPTNIGQGETYQIYGTQFNGLSAGCYYGDDVACATNYPLLRITNNSTGHVQYARTHDHSTMGVATGSAIVSTNFDAPATLELGPSILEVVANGIPSAPFSVNVGLSSTLTYTGSTTSDFNDATTVSAHLVATGGAAISGQTVTFTLGVGTGTETCSALTNSSGDASCSITPTQVPGAYTLTASYAGDLTYGASSVSTGFTITIEETTLAITGPTTSDYADAVLVKAQLTDPVGGGPISGKTVTFVLGSGAGTETCVATTNPSGYATCSITPNQAAGSYTLKASFSGDAFDVASATSTTFIITKEETAIAFTAASSTTQNYHDAATVSAQLTTDDPAPGTPLSGRLVTFTLGAGTGTETCSAPTNGSGVAACSITPNQAAGPYTLTVSYAGDAFYVAASAPTGFTITHEETTTAFTASSATVIANGHPVTFSATLLEDGTTPPVPFGQTLTFTLGSGVTAQTCNGTTNSTGLATCTIPSVNQPLGPNTVGVNFAGDTYYLPSSASEPVILFAFLSQGSMIVGNLDAATGTAVDFWGAQWAKDNSLTGGSAPNSFKGFADTAPQSCGGGWISSPGNSSGPPATVPSYMGVIASSSIGQSGSTISGDVPIIIVVKTNPGYGPDPGHAGTGTVVAVFCH